LGTYSYLNILFTGGDQLINLPIPSGALLLIVLALVLLVWESNRLLQRAFSTPRFAAGRVHPLIGHFLSSLAVSALIAISPLVVLHFVAPFADDLSWNNMKLSIGFTSRINLFLHCINAIVFYMDKYKQAQVEAEHLKIQSIEARFDALRNQINPHFLFNSLNVLSTLVYKDPDTSARFIEQLSNVYRYLLFNQDQKLIPLREELEFLNSYIFLLKIRFQENLNVDVRIQDEYKDRYIAPSTLQLLIENAIKHNVVSKRDPLTIRIYSENGQVPARLVIQNNLQPKESQEPSAKLGLKNIQSRYDFLAGKEAVKIEKDAHFTVKIPLLEVVVK
jgi:sensor histidine kinase YesM